MHQLPVSNVVCQPEAHVLAAARQQCGQLMNGVSVVAIAVPPGVRDFAGSEAAAAAPPGGLGLQLTGPPGRQGMQLQGCQGSAAAVAGSPRVRGCSCRAASG